jgi:hypothetical protein
VCEAMHSSLDRSAFFKLFFSSKLLLSAAPLQLGRSAAEVE